MKVSIITACYNAGSTLGNTIESVAAQDYPDIEYIIVDGGSQDNSLDIIKSHEDKIDHWISEPDEGLYDAMNKGIKMATGDVVGIINADDFYHRTDAVSKIVEGFSSTDVQAVFADIRFVSPENLEKTVRYYSSKDFQVSSFKRGIMPAHPTFFTFRENFEKYGYYMKDFRIAADFELLLRFLYRHQLSFKYIPIDLMKMRTGGLSTQYLRNNIRINREDMRACRMNGLSTNYINLYSRYFKKVWEFLPSIW
ncbi:glycosyltransferase [Echinicola marina]|uniref:glycosyltransferase family 2 protein n=1 Tax=Echinicola marina TaxID=2859768 RepID=UPI001CF6A37E|nr:glycosyltransferase family 2 protein [Echinicola marina]UCS93975.1 glycosyltransferase [Echinicola marina]